MMDSDFGMGWMWFFWPLLVLGLVLLVVVAVRAMWGGATRSAGGQRSAGPPEGRSRARELLDERYARGDISTEEYRERLTALQDGT